MPVSTRRLQIIGSSLLGVFARCTEMIALAPPEARQREMEILEESLGVPAIRTTISGSSVLGSLVCGNSNGFVVTHQAADEDLQRLSEFGKAVRLPARINAAGNVILANDNAALVHPGLSAKACEIISGTLQVDLAQGTIGGLKTVGMAGMVTNQGVLVHPRVSDEELKQIEELFQLPVDVGTVNFGSPLVGSGILANSKGYLAGEETTGPEMGRIEDALGFLK